MQNLTNISNYLGEYKVGHAYSKFDFVYSPHNGLFYYAKNDNTSSEQIVVTAANRFSLDPWGPIYDGAQSFYLNDAHNDMSDYIVGQEINISGSLFNNDGNFKIISIDENYNKYSVRQGDYVLYEVLDAQELSIPNWFESSWFILNSKNFYWPGRDFSAYVDRYIDLLGMYNDNINFDSNGSTYQGTFQRHTKEEWGQLHYKHIGSLENRTVPLNEQANWINHPTLGWTYISSKGLSSSPNLQNKAAWFQLESHEKFWFFSKSNWQNLDGGDFRNQDLSLVKYQEKGEKRVTISKDSESEPFDNPDGLELGAVREIDVSKDGLKMIARENNKITRYTKQVGSWVEGDSIEFNTPYRYLCTNDELDTIAVFSYESGYYTAGTQAHYGGDVDVIGSQGGTLANFTTDALDQLEDAKEEFELYNDYDSVFKKDLFVADLESDDDYSEYPNPTHIKNWIGYLMPDMNRTVPWKKMQETVDLAKIEELEDKIGSGEEMTYAGDVFIYKFNASSQKWELDDVIEKIVEREIHADMSSDGNSIMIFEPYQIEYLYFAMEEITTINFHDPTNPLSLYIESVGYRVEVYTNPMQKVSVFDRGGASPQNIYNQEYGNSKFQLSAQISQTSFVEVFDKVRDDLNITISSDLWYTTKSQMNHPEDWDPQYHPSKIYLNRWVNFQRRINSVSNIDAGVASQVVFGFLESAHAVLMGRILFNYKSNEEQRKVDHIIYNGAEPFIAHQTMPETIDLPSSVSRGSYFNHRQPNASCRMCSNGKKIFFISAKKNDINIIWGSSSGEVHSHATENIFNDILSFRKREETVEGEQHRLDNGWVDRTSKEIRFDKDDNPYNSHVRGHSLMGWIDRSIYINNLQSWNRRNLPSIAVNHEGTVLCLFGGKLEFTSGYGKLIWDAATNKYKEGTRISLEEEVYIEREDFPVYNTYFIDPLSGKGWDRWPENYITNRTNEEKSWSLVPAEFEVFSKNYLDETYLRGESLARTNDVAFSQNQNKIRIAAVIHRNLHPSKYYDHLKFDHRSGIIPLNEEKFTLTGPNALTTGTSPFLNANIVVSELEEDSQTLTYHWNNVYDTQRNSIDFAVDGNIDNLYSLAFDPSLSGKNKLEDYDISDKDYYLLSSSGEGWAYIQEPSGFAKSSYSFDLYDIDRESWFGFKKDGKVENVGSILRPSPSGTGLNVQPEPESGVEPLDIGQNLQTRIWLQGVSGQDEISTIEDRSQNEITITSKNIDLNLDLDYWSTDDFFFDADYGSSVEFSCENKNFKYSDGYYINQPVGINSLKAQVNLLFKNRSNREANAILHFVESHLGQYDKDRPSFNLKNKQGMKGFKWGESSAFYPYDHEQIQSKVFYCLNYNHSLNFENSNDVSLKLTNLNTSLLNKSESLYVRPAPIYSDQETYVKNDVVFLPENHKHYYFISDVPSVGEKPDLRKNIWTRDFLWKPSLGLNIDSKPRVLVSQVDQAYSQIYNDGLNPNLLNLNLTFKNRRDDEAYAILHFLEHHYGCIPFVFSPPAPYKENRNFICAQWTHTYNYKNNHTIEAKFEEFPFQLTAEKYDNVVSPPKLRNSEIIMPDVFLLEDPVEKLRWSRKFRKRFYIKNIGDFPATITSISITNGFFSMVSDKLVANNNTNEYIFSLPVDANLPFGLSGQTIKIFPTYSEGVDGGISFCIMDAVPGGYSRRAISGKLNAFFQNNNGVIVDLINGQSSSSYDKFINEGFFDLNYNNVIDAGGESFIDVYYNESKQRDFFEEQVDGGVGLVTILSSKFLEDSIVVGITHYNTATEVITSKLKMNLHNV